MAEPPFGVAIVGAGFVAGFHVAALDALDGARLVGICDVDAERARRTLASRRDCRIAASLDETLAWPDVDGLVVCTPNLTHAEIAREAIRANKHVLVEKPLALTVDDADELAAEAEHANVVLMPAHTHRFYAYSTFIKRCVEDGRVGDVRYARMTLLAGWIWQDWRAWVLDPALSGGHLLHNGVHGLDLLCWWLDDDPVDVVGIGEKITSPALRIWDHFDVAVRFRGGSVGVVEMSRALRPSDAVIRQVSVVGSRGELGFGADGAHGAGAAGAPDDPFEAQPAFNRQIAAWVDAARGVRQAPLTAAAGRRSIALALAAEQAISEGTSVAVAC